MKAPSNEDAVRLAEVLRNHGVPASVSPPSGKRVEGGDDGLERDTVIRAVELWLLLDTSPSEVKVRFGRERLRVCCPEGEGADLPSEGLPRSA